MERHSGVTLTLTEQEELRLLRFACQPEADAEARAQVIEALRNHRFATVPHQVLYDCLRAVPLSRAAMLETLLPARLVRAGFPDFDLETYLRPSGISAAGARTLCTRLRAKS